jgi:hypothetical protein
VLGTGNIYPTCQIQFDPYGTVVFGLSPSNQCEAGSTFAVNGSIWTARSCRDVPSWKWSGDRKLFL